MRRLFTVLLCTIFLCSCGVNDVDTEISPSNMDLHTSENETSSDSAEYRKISADETRNVMETSKKFILFDVRTEEEYKEKEINGAILMPDYERIERAESELSDKDALILIYCRSGRRSENTAKEFIDMGYSNVYDFGGILDWSYETTSDKKYERN